MRVEQNCTPTGAVRDVGSVQPPMDGPHPDDLLAVDFQTGTLAFKPPKQGFQNYGGGQSFREIGILRRDELLEDTDRQFATSET
jgi:hypothetical protein